MGDITSWAVTGSMQKLSFFMFLLLFPAQFIYSSLVALNIMPPYLGSGISVLISLTFVFLFPIALVSFRELKNISLLSCIVFVGLIIHVISYLIIHYFFGSDVYQRHDVINQWVVLIISWCAIFSIGYYWPEKILWYEVFILLVLLTVMLVLVFTNLKPDKLVFHLGHYSWKSEEYDLYDLRYQGYARLLTTMGLVVLAIIRNKYLFWPVCLLFILGVFLLGARSELACVLLVLPLLVFYQWLENPKVTMLIMTLVIVILSAFVVVKWDEPAISRQMKLLSPAESKSFQHRKKLNEEALQAIAKNPVIGDFSGHTRTHEGVGHYTHNILSSWRQLGIIGFVLYSTLMLWPVIGTLGLFVRDPSLLQIDIWRILGVISVFMLLLALGAKSIFSSMFALSWGMFIAALRYMEPVNKK